MSLIIAFQFRWLSGVGRSLKHLVQTPLSVCMLELPPFFSFRTLSLCFFPGINQPNASGKRGSSVYCGTNPESPLGVSKYPHPLGNAHLCALGPAASILAVALCTCRARHPNSTAGRRSPLRIEWREAGALGDGSWRRAPVVFSSALGVTWA